MLRKILPALFGQPNGGATEAPPAKKWASAYSSDRLHCLLTFSGYNNSSAIDIDGENILLSPDCSDDELGAALVRALAASRTIAREEIGAFFDAKTVVARYESWVHGLMQHCELKTRKALFRGMNSCNVAQENGVISILPTEHDRLEGWGRTKDMNMPTINISAGAAPHEVGAALREAFSHCR
jgi:hypothetical protein